MKGAKTNNKSLENSHLYGNKEMLHSRQQKNFEYKIILTRKLKDIII
jgi:hypothetical protein